MSVPVDVTAMIKAVAESHDLGRKATKRLVRVITGQLPGNRDTPLFALAASIAEAVPDGGPPLGLFDLIGPNSSLSAGHRALLDFLVTTAAEDKLDALDTAIASLGPNADGARVQSAARAFGASLHAFRMRALPHERYRQSFNDIAKFLSETRAPGAVPVDGDAVMFWRAKATRTTWTQYETVLRHLGAYAEAGLLTQADAAQGSEGIDAVDLATEDIFAGQTHGSLVATLAELQVIEVKLVFGAPLAYLQRLATHEISAQRWPGATLAALAFAPVQASLTQLARDRAPAHRLEEATRCANAETYATVTTHLAEARLNLSAAIALHLQSRESGPATSSLPGDVVARMNMMKRRKGFAALSDEDRAQRLADLAPVARDLIESLARVERAFERSRASADDAAFERHKEIFAAKFAELYCGELQEHG